MEQLNTKKVVSIDLKTGQVTAVRHERISDEKKQLLSVRQRIHCGSLYESMRKEILEEAEELKDETKRSNTTRRS